MEFARPGRQTDDGRPIEMIVAPVASREPGRLEFAAFGQNEMCRFHGTTTSPSALGNTTTERAVRRRSTGVRARATSITSGPTVESPLLLRRTIPHACWSSAKILDTATRYPDSANFASAVAFTLVNCDPLHTLSGPIVRHANISLIPASAPGIKREDLT